MLPPIAQHLARGITPPKDTVKGRGYAKVRKLGKGNFGTVWLVRHGVGEDATEFAMKEQSMQGMSWEEKRAMLNEVKVLQKLTHPNIVAYVDSFVDHDTLCLVMELCDGDLCSVIEKRKKTRRMMSEKEVMHYFAQVASGLAYVHHELKCLHRDLKPGNIFLSGGNVKIGDFGLTRVWATGQQMARTKCGTPLYMAPEQARGSGYSRAADVWSVGCVLYELLSLQAPWLAQMGHEAHHRGGGVFALVRMVSSATIDTSAARCRCSAEMCAILDAMLQRDQAARPTLLELLANTLVAGALSNGSALQVDDSVPHTGPSATLPASATAPSATPIAAHAAAPSAAPPSAVAARRHLDYLQGVFPLAQAPPSAAVRPAAPAALQPARRTPSPEASGASQLSRFQMPPPPELKRNTNLAKRPKYAANFAPALPPSNYDPAPPGPGLRRIWGAGPLPAVAAC
uniref:non-specific serine/threonine protein kinase n=1 Tax=Prymnesium polylepis TaxID=72548 RepID=A0A7S4HVL5_9EUKA